jgi:hypothetical protein
MHDDVHGTPRRRGHGGLPPFGFAGSAWLPWWPGGPREDVTCTLGVIRVTFPGLVVTRFPQTLYRNAPGRIGTGCYVPLWLADLAALFVRSKEAAGSVSADCQPVR